MSTLRNRVFLQNVDWFLGHLREVLHDNLEAYWPQMVASGRATPAQIIAKIQATGRANKKQIQKVRSRAQNTGMRQRLLDAGADLTDLASEVAELEAVADALETFPTDPSQILPNLAAINASFPKYEFSPGYDVA